MKCPSCNQELAEGLDVCNHCGMNLNTQPEPITKKKPTVKVIAGVCGGVFVLLIVLLVALIPSDKDKFFKAIANGNPEEAIAVYNESIAADTKSAAAVAETAVQKLEGIRDNFIKGKQSYEVSKSELDKYADISIEAISEAYEAILVQVEELHVSNEAYASGQEYEQNNDFLAALGEYAKVIAEDKNYSAAQERINVLAGNIQAEAQTLLDKKDYKGALAQARAAKAAIRNQDTTELDKLIESCKSAWREQMKELVDITEDDMDNRISVGAKDSEEHVVTADNATLWFDASCSLQEGSSPSITLFIELTRSYVGRISRVKLKAGDFSWAIDFENYESLTTSINSQQINVTCKRLDNEQIEQLKVLLSSEEEIKIRINSSWDFQISNQQRKDVQVILDYYDCLIDD